MDFLKGQVGSSVVHHGSKAGMIPYDRFQRTLGFLDYDIDDFSFTACATEEANV